MVYITRVALQFPTRILVTLQQKQWNFMVLICYQKKSKEIYEIRSEYRNI